MNGGRPQNYRGLGQEACLFPARNASFCLGQARGGTEKAPPLIAQHPSPEPRSRMAHPGEENGGSEAPIGWLAGSPGTAKVWWGAMAREGFGEPISGRPDGETEFSVWPRNGRGCHIIWWLGPRRVIQSTTLSLRCSPSFAGGVGTRPERRLNQTESVWLPGQHTTAKPWLAYGAQPTQPQ